MSNENQPKNKETRHRLSIGGLKLKETGEIVGIIATTHIDRENQMFTKNALQQMVNSINDVSIAGPEIGSSRSISLFHDWIYKGDSTLDEAGFLEPNAKLIELGDGHYGVEVTANINDYYKGDMTPEEIKYRIEQGGIAGFSVEFKEDPAAISTVSIGGELIEVIGGLSQFSGVAFARGRMIANPHAVIYKEIEQKLKEEIKVAEQKLETKEEAAPEAADAPAAEAQAQQEQPAQEEEKKEEALAPVAEAKAEEGVEGKEVKNVGVQIQDFINTKEFKDAVRAELDVKQKIRKEDATMKDDATSLSIKEINASIKSMRTKEGFDQVSYEDARSKYFDANQDWINAKMRAEGIVLNSTLKVKCQGSKMYIAGELQTKDTLDTGSNTTSYTQSPVEFADVYTPGIIHTFNTQANLWGMIPKRDHLEGGSQYGWRISSDQAGALSVDPDDTAVTKNPVDKVKLQTGIKEYRVGVSVTDYMLHHSRASMGDLFGREVEIRTMDLIRDINDDLFSEQVETNNQVLGLEAVADSAGNTTLYGLTRTTANRLAPATATDTYTAVGGALTSALLRQAVRSVEVEGAKRANLRFVVSPAVRDIIFELEDGNLRYFNNSASMGFDGEIRYDGILVIVDSSAQTDAVFVVDFESYYAVISRAPQLNGLAKVGAAEEAYINIYFAIVYEQPRRVYMLDTVS